MKKLFFICMGIALCLNSGIVKSMEGSSGAPGMMRNSFNNFLLLGIKINGGLNNASGGNVSYEALRVLSDPVEGQRFKKTIIDQANQVLRNARCTNTFYTITINKLSANSKQRFGSSWLGLWKSERLFIEKLKVGQILITTREPNFKIFILPSQTLVLKNPFTLQQIQGFSQFCKELGKAVGMFTVVYMGLTGAFKIIQRGLSPT